MNRRARPREQVEMIKERMLEGALAIIVENGYAGLTMRSLAAKTGMTATNIYNYFASKDDIYLALVIRGFQILNTHLTDACVSESDPERRGLAMARAYYTFGVREGHYYDIMFTLPTPKYNDYLGTALEQTARVEMELSQNIIDMSLAAFRDAAGSEPPPEESIRKNLVKLWSFLHGLITLSRSRIIGYVIEGEEKAAFTMIDEMVHSLAL
jgi:AcrR family transcriptional regulator